MFVIVSVVLGRELLRCRDRLVRLESRLNGRPMIGADDLRAAALEWVYATGMGGARGLVPAGSACGSPRGRERAGDRAELREQSEALAELRALYRARRRIELELGELEQEDRDPDAEALIRIEELLLGGCSLRTIPPRVAQALRDRRREDFERLLDRCAPILAGSGGDSAAT